MMRLRSFLIPVFTLFFSFATSQFCSADPSNNKFEKIDELGAKIRQHASAHFKKIYGEEKFSRDVKLRISQLDTRLKLLRCEIPISLYISQPAHQSRNLTVRARCDGDKRWTIFVPLALEVYDNVVVAARSLERGKVISEDDLSYQRVNTAALPTGHVLDMSRIVGMELRRDTRDGSYILLSSLEKPEVVNKGDSVVLESRNSVLTVAARGTALNNGQVGEQIKVRNNQSERVVSALVTGPGKVMVVAR